VEEFLDVQLWILKMGLLYYEEAWHLQRQLRIARMEGRLDDTLLLLQHPPTITMGRGGKEENILVSREHLKKKEIMFYYTDRGGDITYHGPGQLIGYPILNLRNLGLSAGRYIKLMEEVIIITLKELGIKAQRILNIIGLWVGKKKIASLGVRIKKGITTHGFALNINNDLTPFQFIHPCGIKNLKLTSLKEILGKEVDYDFIEERVAINFAQVFNMEIRDVNKIIS
jgi:lipoate-protein ligase B